MARNDLSRTQTALPVDITPDAQLALLIAGSRGVVDYPMRFPKPTVIGRVASADVCVNEQSISRRHACISQRDGMAIIEDLGSRNGTFVNNERVCEGGMKIGIGDAIRIGGIVGQVVLRARESPTAELALAEVLDAELASEIERCLRLGKSAALLVGELSLISSQNSARALFSHMLDVLRPGALVAFRSPVRFDVLIRDCDKTEAPRIAERLIGALVSVSRSTRIGVAVAPIDAASRERLAMVAMTAMSSVATGISVVPDMPKIRRQGNRDIVIADASMVRVFRHAERAAALPIPVLLEGEDGVGKEIVAEAIHLLGPRAKRPFVKVNCAALPEDLLEGEWFGYERGAFSGAFAPKAGLVERAHGGTLFLDQVSELPLGLQAKLLRFVEDKRLTRLGGSRERFVDVRIVATTQRDLRNEVAAGRFRQELFFRLNTLSIVIPPLRERKREIGVYARHFAEQAATAIGRPVPRFTDDAMKLLERSDWPGNIREIRNVVTQAIVFCENDVIDRQHVAAAMGTQEAQTTTMPLPQTTASCERSSSSLSDRQTPATKISAAATTGLPLDEELARIERERVLEALTACGGNQTKASVLLGIPRRTFVYKMAALGITRRRSTKA